MENQTQTPIANSPQPKANNFLVILLSILLFISVAISGFFAWQTQKLVNELRVMSDELKQTIAPITNNLQPSITPDPTANWKTYINEKLGITLKYPFHILPEKDAPNGDAIFSIYWPDVPKATQFLKIFRGYKTKTADYATKTKIDGVSALVFDINKDLSNPNYVLRVVQLSSPEIEINIDIYDEQVNVEFDQILSTFKFTN